MGPVASPRRPSARERFGAFFLDVIVVGPLLFAAVMEGLLLMSLPFLWPWTRGLLPGFPDQDFGASPHLELRVGLALLAGVVAYKLALEAWCAGTVGRLMAHQIVLDEQGRTLGVRRAFLRWLGRPGTCGYLRHRVPTDQLPFWRVVGLTFLLLQITAIGFIAAVGGF
jgi:hypothetical protein